MEHIRQSALSLVPGLRELFFTLHQYPELGNQERQTAALVRRRLEELGIEYVPSAGTGTAALIRGAGRGKPWASGRTWTRCPSSRRPACPTPPGGRG